jgi:hypothetical protein
VERGIEQRACQAIEPLGCAGPRVAPAGRVAVCGEVAIEGLVGLGLDPDDHATAAGAAGHEEVMVARPARDVVEPGAALHDRPLQPRAGERAVRLEQPAKPPLRIPLHPGVRELVRAAVLAHVVRGGGRCEPQPVGECRDPLAAVVLDSDSVLVEAAATVAGHA